ncbi:hypothetical protein IFM89_020451 [Coptis chinensis]|uniref:Bet v I/Major latex protein domain-containing protein n=1 Tax=Coptis chinensis TaxID=261450 RepID=A0A835LFV1_9MAGN|nr:hypothetical protein IFM89_020451 [Coptis chinensis]
MEGQLEHELEVSVPASEVWDVYGGLKLGKLVCELLPNVIEKVELVEGDGGVGTILKVVFPQGTPGFTFYKEMFTKVDNEKRLKEAEVVEGGYLEFGFSLYRVRFEIIEKDAKSSIIKTTIEYEVDTATNASIVSSKALELIAETIAKYLTEKQV